MNKTRRIIRQSIKLKIRSKMTLLIFILITLAISATWLLNKYFLTSYYIHSEKNFLKEVYYDIQEKSKDNNNEMYNDIYSLSYSRKASIFVADIILHRDQYRIKNYFSSVNPSGLEFDSFNTLVLNAINKIDVKKINYNILVNYDEILSENFLILQGMLDSDTFIVVRLPVKDMEENAVISNRFLFYCGLFVILIGAVSTYFISRRITKPIQEIALVAQNLIGQRFDMKVKMITNDELGDLGNNINLLSAELEETISNLKQANLELQNDILYKTEMDEIRRDFLSQISHELKTPIALIQGYAEALDEDVLTDDENRKYYSEVIIDESRKMNELVSKLLTLNQLEFGKKELHIVNFNIIDVIASRIEAFHSQIDEKNLKVHFDSQSSVFVWADELMLEEVINNYLSNAIQHTDSGRTISIYYQCEGSHVRIFIRNEGNHIPEEDIPNIWTKLYKVDKARSRDMGGIGLGLSIVAAIMNAHGKSYGVHNVENGVEFYIDL